MLPDIVIPVRVTPYNPSLDITLSTIAQHHPGQRVTIVGHLPKLGHHNIDLLHIPTRQRTGTAAKFTNQELAMRTALNDDRVPEQFIWSNDDIYWTRPWEPELWHQGPLPTEGTGRYTARKLEARRILQAHGLPTLDYELHTPMPVRKDTMTRALELGGTMRTMYGNLAGGTYNPDVKVRKPLDPIPDSPVVSSAPATLHRIREHLACLAQR